MKKNFWRNIHLYLGLAAGLVFFIECLSGAILVFEDEITEMLQPKRFYVDAGDRPRLAVDALLECISTQIAPDERITNIRFQADTRKTAEVNLKKIAKRPANAEGKPRAGKPDKGGNGEGKRAPRGDVLTVNPYTGAITARVNPSEPTFFSFMLRLHQSLVLDSVGKTILGISTFVVMLILITGMVLWWPKNRKVLSARLKMKTDASWKRINHDLHVVLGFYCTFFLLIFLLTSLPWSFKWANDALYTLTGSTKEANRTSKEESGMLITQNVSWERVFQTAKSQLPEAPYWSIEIRDDVSDKPIQVTAASTTVYHRNGFDRLSIDPRTGKVTDIQWHHDSAGGWQLRRYMKPVHTGAIGGMPTKVLAFVVCIISASFPVTGVILWLNRIGKSKKKNKFKLA